MEYPIKFDLCPNCGSQSKVIESETNDQISRGNVKVGSKFALLLTKTPIFDASNAVILAPRKIPIIMGYFDVCCQCGTLYCVELQKAEGLIEPNIKPKKFDLGGNGDGMPFLKG